MRLDKFVLRSTQLNKQQVVKVIESGLVSVNQQIITDCAIQVHENNHITYNSNRLTPRPFRYLLLHKSPDTLCSNVDGEYPSVFNDIDIENKDELHIVGRLDADTSGLILITDDGRWSFNITRPDMDCPKVYRVTLAKPITEDAITKLEQGLLLQGESTSTRPAKIIKIDDLHVLLTITEGRYHQVKRMFFAVGNRVNQLHREKIGAVSLDLDSKQWRHLTASEISSFGMYSQQA
ncbi:pseudouridine synthase [Shewanella japonica]|uniref:Pseudouridine synthase n=1 Tax=Shewanella japonica TaxID=93973 RepID=A0ABM6JJR3_9GAMM|nr:pseudouridine synthase [Shewanella japonica]ARD22376.1 Pseudouridine synthase [Shewanella japonica]